MTLRRRRSINELNPVRYRTETRSGAYCPGNAAPVLDGEVAVHKGENCEMTTKDACGSGEEVEFAVVVFWTVMALRSINAGYVVAVVHYWRAMAG